MELEPKFWEVELLVGELINYVHFFLLVGILRNSFAAACDVSV